jgi:serine/threonine-protein phosphatase 2A regulatory subunit B''
MAERHSAEDPMLIDSRPQRSQAQSPPDPDAAILDLMIIDSPSNSAPLSVGVLENSTNDFRLESPEHELSSPSCPESLPVVDPPSDSNTEEGTSAAAESNSTLGQFYFPIERGASERGARELAAIGELFAKFGGQGVQKARASGNDFGAIITRGLSLPKFFADRVFERAQKWSPELGFVTEAAFREYYLQEAQGLTPEERLLRILLPEGSHRLYITREDLVAFLTYFVAQRPGLPPMRVDIQYIYAITVAERIFYSCSRAYNDRLTLRDIKRSKLLDTFLMVDKDKDINNERKYFSYQHFYVLYVNFVALDSDKDMHIKHANFLRHFGHALSYRIADRVFYGYGRGLENSLGLMTYCDYIWFCLSENDKSSETAIDYWFRCVDLDGDGVIALWEVQCFYEEQRAKMDEYGEDAVTEIPDAFRELLDMLKPRWEQMLIRRSDLKACKLADRFFNALFNLEKFLESKKRPTQLQLQLKKHAPEFTDWDRFVYVECKRLSKTDDKEEDEEIDIASTH